VADLAALRELYAFMREANVLYARCGDLELRLGPLSAPPVSPSPDLTDFGDGDDPERRSMEALLYSSGADVDEFLNVMRKQRGEAA
jgi:hypothetical protein